MPNRGLGLHVDMDIPQELIDKIIDRVWDADDSPSQTTTKATSLVSKSWVERSQHHLFHDITFSFGPSFDQWCDAVSPGPDGVSRHVRSLTIEGRGTYGEWISEDSLERGLPFFDSFRNVQALRIRHWNIEPFPPELLTRCLAPFAGGVRILQWDPHPQVLHEAWTRAVGMFPLTDYLLLFPNFFPFGLLSGIPVGPGHKKLVLSGDSAVQCLARGGVELRFREIYIRCGPRTTIQDIIAIVNGCADRLEILSIVGTRRGWAFFCVACPDPQFSPAIVIDASNKHLLPSLLSGCHTLQELSIDWLPVDPAPEVHLIDSIPGGCIRSLRILPGQALWQNMWGGSFLHIESSRFMPQHESLAQAIFRLGVRNSGRKISVWFIIPRVPYAICEPLMECIIALWEKVGSVVSFGFQMTETDSPGTDGSHSFPPLA